MASSARPTRTQRLLAYFGVPVVFCALGYAILFAALQPVWDVLTATVGILIAEEAPTFDSNLTTTYDAKAYKKTSQQSQQSQQQTSARSTSKSSISGDDVVFPEEGEQYARIINWHIGLNAPVYWGDSDEILMYGLGQSIISLPPGFGTAVILSGHNNTYLQCLQYAQEGYTIQIRTNYGTYQYKVTSIEVLNEGDLEKILIDAAVDDAGEQLILYTCYPFHVVTGRKTERLVVFAKKISGPKVEWRAED